jgi:hypothetical protein
MIFYKFLKKGKTGDCSGDSRSATLALNSLGRSPARLTINSITARRREDIYVPVIIDSSAQISAFGLDFAFPSEVLTFLGIERTAFTSGYQDVAANVLLSSMDSDGNVDQEPNYGIVRIGGYRTEETQGPTSGVLIVLVFRVTGELEAGPPISVIATYDDLQNASLASRMMQSESRKKSEQELRDSSIRSPRKKFDF